METNTVLLSLEDYNELRDFKTEIEKGNTFCGWHYGWGSDVRYISTDEAVREMAECNKELQDKIHELNDTIAGKPKEIKLKDVYKMSIWQFMKWKRNG